MTEQHLKEAASEMAMYITIRTYVNGSSCDTRRKSTPSERKTLSGVLNGALFALNWSRPSNPDQDFWQQDGIINGAEDIARQLLDTDTKEVNCYDSVYCQLRLFVRNWPTEEC